MIRMIIDAKCGISPAIVYIILNSLDVTNLRNFGVDVTPYIRGIF